MSIADWKLSCNSVEVAQILSFVPGIDQTKVKFKTLDGTIYIQTIGDGSKEAEVSIYTTREKLGIINQAEADGLLIRLIYRDVQYDGYIDEPVNWSAIIAGESYVGTFKLLVETEVAL